MQSPRTRLLALLPLLACGGAGDVTPKSGTWNYDSNMLLANNCGDSVPEEPVGSFTLTVGAGSKFTVTPGSGDPFDCTYGDGTFSCPVSAAGTVMEDGIDATATYEVGYDGDLDSPTALSGVKTVSIACEGSACPLLMQFFGAEALPCEYSYSFTATAS